MGPNSDLDSYLTPAVMMRGYFAKPLDSNRLTPAQYVGYDHVNNREERYMVVYVPRVPTERGRNYIAELWTRGTMVDEAQDEAQENAETEVEYQQQ